VRFRGRTIGLSRAVHELAEARRTSGGAERDLLAFRAALQTLVQMGGKEPGVIREPGKIKHLDLTGMNGGHTETSTSGAE
jgi:hypothetical protein